MMFYTQKPGIKVFVKKCLSFLIAKGIVPPKYSLLDNDDDEHDDDAHDGDRDAHDDDGEVSTVLPMMMLIIREEYTGLLRAK